MVEITKKRYMGRYGSFSDGILWDNVTEERLSHLEICTLVNEQAEEIIRLEHKIDNLMDENIGLKQSIELLEDMVEVVMMLRDELDVENDELISVIIKVHKLLAEDVDLFSDKALEHDTIAYRELHSFDNKDAYYMAYATKQAIKKLERVLQGVMEKE